MKHISEELIKELENTRTPLVHVYKYHAKTGNFYDCWSGEENHSKQAKRIGLELYLALSAFSKVDHFEIKNVVMLPNTEFFVVRTERYFSGRLYTFYFTFSIEDYYVALDNGGHPYNSIAGYFSCEFDKAEKHLNESIFVETVQQELQLL